MQLKHQIQDIAQQILNTIETRTVTPVQKVILLKAMAAGIRETTIGLNNTKPTHVSDDWQGEVVGKKHKQQLNMQEAL